MQRDGAEITQAGGSNYRDITLARGFAGHPAAWGAHEVQFYAHGVAPDGAAAAQPAARSR